MSGAKKRVPKRRFKEFLSAGDWKQRKLSDISTKVTTKNVDVHYTETLTNSAEQGIISQVDFFEKEISNKNNINGYYIVENNDFIYNPRISTLAPVGPINRNKLNRTGIMSPLYTVFRASNIDLDFLEWYFQSNHWYRYMKLNGDSGARADRIAIKDSTFFDMPIKTPVNIKEQVLIGETLEKFNQYITLHQRKLDKLQATKKALLQEMFPEEGQDKPKRRFKGFTDAWEQRKLNDFVIIRRGLTYKPSDIAENGIRVLRSSNIDEDQFITSNDDVFVNKDAVNIPFAKNGDILITSANGSNRLVGKHTIISDIAENSTVHGGFMLLAESKNPLFTDALLSSNWYKRFINTYVAGGNGAIGNLSKSDLENQTVVVPSEHEQAKIGQWYDNINQLITLHQRKLDKLKNLKQAYLNEMFV